MTNSFALNCDKNLQIYFFYVKRQAKNDFRKDVESRVDQTCICATWLNSADPVQTAP